MKKCDYIFKDKEKLEEIEEFFLCPISYEFMKNPVILVQTGMVFERRCIEEWLKRKKTCPITNVKITYEILIPVLLLRNIIECYLEALPDIVKQNLSSLNDLSDRFNELEQKFEGKERNNEKLNDDFIKSIEKISDLEQRNIEYFNIIESSNTKIKELELTITNLKKMLSDKSSQSMDINSGNKYFEDSNQNKLSNSGIFTNFPNTSQNYGKAEFSNLDGFHNSQSLGTKKDSSNNNFNSNNNNKINFFNNKNNNVSNYNIDKSNEISQNNKKTNNNKLYQNDIIDQLFDEMSDKSLIVENDLSLKSKRNSTDFNFNNRHNNNKINDISLDKKNIKEKSKDNLHLTLRSYEKPNNLLEKTINYTKAKLINSYLNHKKPVLCMIKLTDSIIISGSEDSSLVIWILKENSLIYGKTLDNVHSGSVTCLIKFNDSIFISGSEDQTIIIWKYLKNTDAIKKNQVLKNHHNYYIKTLLKFDDKIFVSASFMSIIIWKLNFDNDKEVFELSQKLSCHSKFVRSLLKISNTIFISCSEDNSIIQWKYYNGAFNILNSIKTHHSDSINYSMSLTEGFFCTASNDSNINIWKINGEKIEFYQTLKSHKNSVNILLNISAMKFLSIGADKDVKVWIEKNGDLININTIEFKTDIYCILKLTDSQFLIGCSNNSVLQFGFEEECKK